jgi:hypothetical protein
MVVSLGLMEKRGFGLALAAYLMETARLLAEISISGMTTRHAGFVPPISNLKAVWSASAGKPAHSRAEPFSEG